MSSPSIVVENLWKLYSRTVALRNINMVVNKGLNLIVGPNGSGKSTLLRIITGISKPTKGRVEVFGLDPWKNHRDIVSRIGIGFEAMKLPWWLTGLDILRGYSSEKNIEWSIVREHADMLGVSNYWSRLVRGYSDGMKKKLVLVMALSSAVEALILDEPFTLLDRKSIGIVDDIIVEKSKKIPVVVATHIITPSLGGADTVHVLVNGSLAASYYREEASVSISDYQCRVVNQIEFLDSIRSVADQIEYLEYEKERILITLKDRDKGLSLLKGIAGCRPSITRYTSYEKYIGVERDESDGTSL